MTKTSDEEPVMTRGQAAAQWTRAYLKGRGGQAPSQDVYAAGEGAGYRKSTLERVLKTDRGVIAVKEGRYWVWKLADARELATVAATHAVDLTTLEERWKDRTRPRRTIVTHWPCRGVSRVYTEVLDPNAPGGVIRRTSWVHSEPTSCNIQVPGGEAK